jgi:hypothetical protein
MALKDETLFKIKKARSESSERAFLFDLNKNLIRGFY